MTKLCKLFEKHLENMNQREFAEEFYNTVVHTSESHFENIKTATNEFQELIKKEKYETAAEFVNNIADVLHDNHKQKEGNQLVTKTIPFFSSKQKTSSQKNKKNVDLSGDTRQVLRASIHRLKKLGTHELVQRIITIPSESTKHKTFTIHGQELTHEYMNNGVILWAGGYASEYSQIRKEPNVVLVNHYAEKREVRPK